MLCVDNIYKHYGNHRALNGVSLDIHAGQVVALLAPNGAGKSTLVSIIAGLLKADNGTITINGKQRHKHKNNPEIQSILGIAGQETGLYPGLTVHQNLQFFSELYDVPRRARQKRIKETAKLLGLELLLRRKANELSGGERRRLHTACALIHRPRLLLLDEPTVGADPQARNDILNAVKQLAFDGTAVLYTSHYLPEIEALNADLVIMDKGQVLDQGKQKTLINQYGEHTVSIEFSRPIAAQAEKLLKNSQCMSPTQLKVNNNAQQENELAHILSALQAFNNDIVQIEQQSATLEHVFLRIIANNQPAMTTTHNKAVVST